MMLLLKGAVLLPRIDSQSEAAHTHPLQVCKSCPAEVPPTFAGLKCEPTAAAALLCLSLYKNATGLGLIELAN
jgi:hypothetical protein